MGVETGKLGDVVIGIGTGISGRVRIADVHWLGIQMPTAWDAANLGLEFSSLANPSTADADWWVWRGLMGEVQLPAAANVYLTLSGSDLLPTLGVPTWMRFNSGTRAVRVNQTANRTLGLFTRRFS